MIEQIQYGDYIFQYDTERPNLRFKGGKNGVFWNNLTKDFNLDDEAKAAPKAAPKAAKADQPLLQKESPEETVRSVNRKKFLSKPFLTGKKTTLG